MRSPLFPILLAACAAAFVTLPAGAQGVYKSVDKDGHVIYTDRPSNPAVDGGAATQKLDIHTDALAPDKSLFSGAATDTSGAAAAVIGAMHAVDGVQRMCANESGPTRERARVAVATWNFQHEALIGKADAVNKAVLSNAQYQVFSNMMNAMDQAITRRLANLSPAQRTQACNELPANLSSAKYNLMANRQLVAALDRKP